MYAALVTVKLDATRPEDVMKNLHESVVPRSKQAPGFVRARGSATVSAATV